MVQSLQVAVDIVFPGVEVEADELDIDAEVCVCGGSRVCALCV